MVVSNLVNGLVRQRTQSLLAEHNSDRYHYTLPPQWAMWSKLHEYQNLHHRFRPNRHFYT
jgi:hypothetical protein